MDNARLQTKQILVVDDDVDILDAIKLVLSLENYRVIVASREIEVYQQLKENRPDLILLDALLSGDDGREICKNLKADKDTASIPVVMVSAHPSAHRVITEAGADDFIAKPFDIDQLLEKVRFHTSL